jgi:hypothetical protein
MELRARDRALHGLRLLQVGLSFGPLHKRQLRFRLGETYAFDERAGGWTMREDAAWEGSLTDDMRTLVAEQPAANLPYESRTDVEAKANLALKWIDRARFATEPIVATLYLFFALEALLGDTAEGQKAFRLVFRRTVLGEAASGGFPDPISLYYLYDEVRSAAVHGSEAPELSAAALSSFDWNVRRALNEYLSFAHQNGFTRRSQLVTALDGHEHAGQVREWLGEHDPRWKDFDPSPHGR